MGPTIRTRLVGSDRPSLRAAGLLCETILAAGDPQTLRLQVDRLLVFSPSFHGLIALRARLAALSPGAPNDLIRRDLALLEDLRASQHDTQDDYTLLAEQLDEICRAWILEPIAPDEALRLLQGVGRLGSRNSLTPTQSLVRGTANLFRSEQFKQLHGIPAFEPTVESICFSPR